VYKLSKLPGPVYSEPDPSEIKPAHRDTVFDLNIIQACQNGNKVAWKNFYEAQFDFVYRMTRRLGTPNSETEDVVHDVFIVAFRKINDFKSGNIQSWLYRITAHVVSDRHRKRRVRDAFKKLKVWFGVRSTLTPERAAQRSSAARAVSEILQHMSDKKREVFSMFEIEGISGENIATRLDIPLNTVWTRLHHARKDFLKIAKRLDYLDEVIKK